MRDLKFEQRWLVVDVATDADLGQWEGVHQVCDPTAQARTCGSATPATAGSSGCCPAKPPRTSRARRPRPAHRAVDHTSRRRRAELVRVAEYTFRAQIADRWRRGNVFLLGDAAHLTPPFIGQGMGAGLRDAMNLAWKLAGVLDAGLPPTILDTYEQERKPHARFMIGMALGMGWAMTAGGDVGNLIRRLVVPRLHLVPGLRDKLIESKTPALHRSAFVKKARAPWQLAGTLCPILWWPTGSALTRSSATDLPS